MQVPHHMTQRHGHPVSVDPRLSLRILSKLLAGLRLCNCSSLRDNTSWNWGIKRNMMGSSIKLTNCKYPWKINYTNSYRTLCTHNIIIKMIYSRYWPLHIPHMSLPPQPMFRYHPANQDPSHQSNGDDTYRCILWSPTPLLYFFSH